MRVLKAKVYGKVQGVWFRKFTQESAQNIGIVGTVKNLDDGTVIVSAFGERQKLTKFKQWLKTGSPNSRVDKIDYSWKNLSTDYLTFEIEF